MTIQRGIYGMVASGAGFLGVALGAFGAHALKVLLATNGTLEFWKTAVLYHFVHALLLVWFASRDPVPRILFWCATTGIVLFSGSLYLLALTNIKWFGAITPFGGFCFLLAWGGLFARTIPTRYLNGRS